MFFHGLGLASKSTAMVAPVLLLILDGWLFGRLPLETRIQRRAASIIKKMAWLMAEKIPLVALSIPVALFAVLVHESKGASGSLVHDPLGTRIMNTPIFYAFYIRKFFWPGGLAAFYPYPDASAISVLMAIILLAVITIAALVWRKQCPTLLPGWLWYILAMAPVCGIARVASFLTADRYAYIPLIGVFVMLSWALADFGCWITDFRFWKGASGGMNKGNWAVPLAQETSQSPFSMPPRRILFAMIACWLAVLTVAGMLQTRHWRDSFALFSHALEATSNNYLAYNNLGLVLLDKGRLDEAKVHFLKALEEDKRVWEGLLRSPIENSRSQNAGRIRGF